MNKEQFLDELEKLLQDIDSIERDEALNYYRDYFEDAGSEHEQEIIDELGTPEKVAQTIKEGLDINEQENEEVIHHYNERNTSILRGIIVVLLVLLILPTIGGVGGLVVARIVCKLLLCNGTVLAMYGLVFLLVPAGSISQELRTTALAVSLATLAMGNVAFVLYDRALHNMLMMYRLVWRPKLHKTLGWR